MGLAGQLCPSILLSCPDKDRAGREDPSELWNLGRPWGKGRAWRDAERSWAPGARGAVGGQRRAVGGGRSVLSAVGGAPRCALGDSWRAQRQRSERWQVLQITAAEQSLCLDNVGRAIVHKLVSSTTPACTDNNPLSLSGFQRQKTAVEGGASRYWR